MSINDINSTKNDFEKLQEQLFEIVEGEMEDFKASYKNLDTQQAYNDWYIIGFYESYYNMLSSDFLDDKGAEDEIVWLCCKEKPFDYLYNKWMEADGAFSYNWDDMLDFIRKVYEKERTMEPVLTQPQNNRLGEYDISALMSTLANNAWFGIKPTEMCFQAGDDIIKLEGYLYEPIYEDFSSTASISFNGEVLYGIDSKNVAAYKNEVYQKGRYNTLEEAISYIKEQIKGKEVVLSLELQNLDKKITTAIDRAKNGTFPNGLIKKDIDLD